MSARVRGPGKRCVSQNCAQFWVAVRENFLAVADDRGIEQVADARGKLHRCVDILGLGKTPAAIVEIGQSVLPTQLFKDAVTPINHVELNIAGAEHGQ